MGVAGGQLQELLKAVQDERGKIAWLLGSISD